MIVFEITGNKGEGAVKQCFELVESLRKDSKVWQILLIDTVGVSYTYPTEMFPFVTDVYNENDLRNILSFNFPAERACVQVYDLAESKVREIVQECLRNTSQENICFSKQRIVILLNSSI